MTRKTTSRRATNLIDSAAKRSRLAARRDPYWQPVGPQRGGVSIGYRRLHSGPGSWTMRLIVDKKRMEARLGEADDAGSAAGALDYAQAFARALTEGKLHKEQAARATAPAPAVTVRVAIADYVALRKARNLHHGRDAEVRLAKHVLVANEGMADRALSRLDTKDWSGWRMKLTGMSPAGITRLINDLKAAMNSAWRTHRRSLPPHWQDDLVEGLRPPDGSPPAPAPQVRDYLPDADVRRLVVAVFDTDADFGNLVMMLAATGARFSQAARLTAADVLDGCIWMPSSRKGRSGSCKSAKIKVQVGDDVIDALKVVTQGRAGHMLLLQHWRKKQVKGDKTLGLAPCWLNSDRIPWSTSAETTRFWKAALKKAGLPEKINLTALRDASIIRSLREGVPLDVVARIHDTSGPIIRRHYALFIHDALDELARRAVVPIAPAPAMGWERFGNKRRGHSRTHFNFDFGLPHRSYCAA